MMPPAPRLKGARGEAERARKRFMTTLAALRYRLHPSTVAAHARESVKEKSRDLAEDAIQAVRDRPAAVSGIAAGIVLFLARKPLWSAISDLWSDREPIDESIVTTDLDTQDENYDLTAPAMNWSNKQGASA